MLLRRVIVPLAGLSLPALALAGCSATEGALADGSGDGAVRIVTSTTVYADLVGQVVGDAAEVEAVIDSAAVDPHDYEATARDGLTVQDADLVIVNGGGYDHFMTDLVESAGAPHVINVVEFNHDYPGAVVHDHDGEGHEVEDDTGVEGEHADHEHADHNHIEGFNEHVWYDPHTMAHFVEGVQEELAELIPDASGQIASGVEGVVADIEALEARLDVIADDHEGETVFFTEPVGEYLTTAAGLTDVTVDGFAEAVEHGEGVAPATLNDAVKSIEGGDVGVLVANAQTGGSETERVIQAAEQSGVPVVEFTETVPDGSDYFAWMNANADAIADALE